MTSFKTKKVVKPRVPRTHAGGTWTKSRYFSFIRSALRRAWTRYPVKFKVLNEASRPYVGPDTRRKKEFKCAICEEWYPPKEVEVDHITPCGSLKDYDDLPRFVKTLFCEEDNLQVLCKSCHHTVTQEQKNE